MTVKNHDIPALRAAKMFPLASTISPRSSGFPRR
jgi:hypothetical protein